YTWLPRAPICASAFVNSRAMTFTRLKPRNHDGVAFPLHKFAGWRDSPTRSPRPARREPRHLHALCLGSRFCRPLGIDPDAARVVEVPECRPDHYRHGSSRSRRLLRLPASPYAQPRCAGSRGGSVSNRRGLSPTDSAFALFDPDWNLSHASWRPGQPRLQPRRLPPDLGRALERERLSHGRLCGRGRPQPPARPESGL